MRICRIITVLLIIWLAAFRVVSGQDFTKLKAAKVIGTGHENVTLPLPEHKPVVIITLATDCPISQKYIPTIKQLKQTFEGVDFIGVFPQQTSHKELSLFIKEYDVSFPCFIDGEAEALKITGATVTPEVFLFNKDLHLLYSGAIDNWFFDLGSYRTNITEHHLRDALKAVSDGTVIQVRHTEAIGCPIPKKASPHQSNHHHH